jgi:hypothetical protein
VQPVLAATEIRCLKQWLTLNGPSFTTLRRPVKPE